MTFRRGLVGGHGTQHQHHRDTQGGGRELQPGDIVSHPLLGLVGREVPPGEWLHRCPVMTGGWCKWHLLFTTLLAIYQCWAIVICENNHLSSSISCLVRIIYGLVHLHRTSTSEFGHPPKPSCNATRGASRCKALMAWKAINRQARYFQKWGYT